MASLAPISGQVIRNSSGVPYLAARASFYADVGLSIPLSIWTDAGLTSAHPNPVLSSGTTGAFPAVYLSAARYWMTVTTSTADGTVSLPTYNLGPIDATPGWVTSVAAPSPTYPFLRWYSPVAGGGTGLLSIRASDDLSWISLGPVDALLNSSSVAQQLTGTVANVASTPDSVAALWQRGTDITPAAGVVSLPSTGGGVFTLNAGAVSSITASQGGRTLFFTCAGANALTHNATSFELDGGAAYTTAAGDILITINKAATDVSGSNYRIHVIKKSGNPVSVSDFLASKATVETNTSTTQAPSVSTIKNDPGVAKFFINFDGTGTIATRVSHNVTGIADGGTGRYTITIATDFSSANWCIGFGFNTTVVGNISTSSGQVRSADETAMTAGTVEIQVGNAGAGSVADTSLICVFGFGDQ